jgi:hypothetical protein
MIWATGHVDVTAPLSMLLVSLPFSEKLGIEKLWFAFGTGEYLEKLQGHHLHSSWLLIIKTPNIDDQLWLPDAL